MQDSLVGSRVHVDSIKLMAESAGVSELSIEAATTISDEITLRLRQIITKAQRFTAHSNRTRLTCADINKSLKCSDCQPVFGHECNPNSRPRYSYLPEAQVFRYEDETVDLAERFKKHSQTQCTLEGAEPKVTLERLDQSASK